MLGFFRRRPVFIAAIAAALLASACAGRRGREPETRIAYDERPVELLYATGAQALDLGLNDLSIIYFNEVERQHPYSEWARRAILMTAFANYRGRKYPEAIADAERFIQLYPGNPATPYAYYLRAVSYFDQIIDVGRDQATTEQARAALREIVQRFPNTDYGADARLKLDMVQDQLAGKEMAVGRYYLREGSTLAAIGRFKAVIDQYQTTSHTPEALYRLVEGYLTLGIVEEARRNGAVLGHNFPGDPWYADAYGLLEGRGQTPEVTPTSNRRRGPFGLFGRQRAEPAEPNLPQNTALPPPAQ